MFYLAFRRSRMQNTYAKVGVRSNTPFKNLALSIYNNQIAILEFPDTPSLLEGLKAKTIDVVLMDSEVIKSWIANNSIEYKSIGAPIPVGFGYGIMANKENNKLITQINQALLSMMADGAYMKIYKKYFMSLAASVET